MYITLCTLLSITLSTLFTRPLWSFSLNDKLNPFLSLIKSRTLFNSLSFRFSNAISFKSLNFLQINNINDSLFLIIKLSKSIFLRPDETIFSIYTLHVTLLVPIYFAINFGSFLDNKPTFSSEIKFAILLFNICSVLFFNNSAT